MRLSIGKPKLRKANVLISLGEMSQRNFTGLLSAFIAFVSFLLYAYFLGFFAKEFVRNDKRKHSRNSWRIFHNSAA